MIKNSNIIYYSLISIIILLLLSSCGEHSIFSLWNKESDKDCILKSELSYNQILSKEDLKKVLSIKSEVLLEESNGSPSKQDYGYCYYTWQSNRPDKKSELSEHILIPDNNYVRIENYKWYDITLGKEEIEKQFYEEFLKLNNHNDSSVKGRIKSNNENKKKSKLKHTNFHYIWEASTAGGGKLIFLKSNEKLEISIKMSSDPEENLKSAQKFAQIIINKCK